jgi:hypothetical protein
MLGKITVTPEAKTCRQKPVEIDADDGDDVVQRKVAALRKKKAPKEQLGKCFDLRQTEEGVLVSDPTKLLKFLLSKEDLSGYESPVNMVFGTCNGTSKVVLTVGHNTFESTDVSALMHLFSVIRE